MLARPARSTHSWNVRLKPSVIWSILTWRLSQKLLATWYRRLSWCSSSTIVRTSSTENCWHTCMPPATRYEKLLTEEINIWTDWYLITTRHRWWRRAKKKLKNEKKCLECTTLARKLSGSLVCYTYVICIFMFQFMCSRFLTLPRYENAFHILCHILIPTTFILLVKQKMWPDILKSNACFHFTQQLLV